MNANVPEPGRGVDRVAGHPWTFGVVLVALCGLGAYWRFAGLDPPSLVLDDEWVGIVVRKMSWREYFGILPPVPVGFVAVLKALAAPFDDPEWPLQLYPAACSIALLPLVAILVARLTGRRSLGVLAAVLLLVNPHVAAYAVRTKQYTGDALMAVILLLVGMPLLERWSPRRAAATCAVGVGALLLSFPSVFLSIPLVHVSLARLVAGRSRLRAVTTAAGVVLAFDLCLALVYGVLLRGQSNDAMRTYWSGFFLPLDSLPAAGAFLYHRLLNGLVGGALPGPGWSRLALAFPLLVIGLLYRRDTRGMGLFLVLFHVLLVAAAASGLYPVGTLRTDLFSYPMTIVAACVALGLVGRGESLRRYTGVVLSLVSLGLVGYYGHASGYTPSEDARLVRELDARAGEGDAILLYPHASFPAGYYGPWPVTVSPWDDYAHGFEVRLVRDRAVTLRARVDLADRPSQLEPEIASLLAERPPRLLYLAAYADERVHRYVHETILRSGYRPVDSLASRQAQLIVYETESAPTVR